MFANAVNLINNTAMGWFLTRKKSKKRSSHRRTGDTKPVRWDPQRTLFSLKVMGCTAIAAVIVISVHKANRALIDYASAHRAALATMNRVELVDAPPWMAAATRNQIIHCVVDQLGIDPMDGRDLAFAAAALRDQPWVRRVHQVRRLTDGRVQIHADFREPIALVRSHDGYRLIDGAAICLPGLYRSDQASRLALPLVSGVQVPPPPPGHSWPGRDLRAGLRLIRLLAGEPYVDQIRRYDVSGRDRRGRVRLKLHTKHGMVRWGLPPGQEQTIEQSTATKIIRLRHVNSIRGSIDAGGNVVDLYGPQVAINQAVLWTDEHPDRH